MTENLTIGERVAWYRRRRGMSQEALAGLVGRTGEWLRKAENNRAELDRLSVIRRLADALDVALGDLIGEPTLLDWTPDSGTATVPALRAALMDYRQLTPILSAPASDAEPPPLDELARELRSVFDAYQGSRFGFATGRAPLLLADALLAARQYEGDLRLRAHELLALSYQAAASVLTKLGESDLAWMAAERGLAAAQQTGNPAITGSLFRSVSFALLSTGRHEPAMQLTEAGAAYLEPHLHEDGGDLLSAYGTLFLAGSMAASRSEDRAKTRSYLAEADDAARRLGVDGNRLWTAFGPTNVAIHRVNTAMELGDVQIALDLGPNLDTSALPLERQVRHMLDVARAYNVSGQLEAAVTTVLDAERKAPDQVRHHYLSRQLVLNWVRNAHGKPPFELDQLARRMHVVG
ncbi:helix-turn-helix domain-containing protein [Amycolatopsis sp. H20-H5]|uniref:helix-turn-helix domain-containing protein n=1 Tax=Amycolatopsis sp. H20-H5 TaxID=3046309 RepID=UPI002DBA9EEA|nr:helix-turn-helix transcriptional regulator [Amycolatopsis sp. H20-H5]MEC3976235.1 helix-turn-helix transcriptional regulator [Amycolatopsis sp. H20-H5]